jgi:hypothetical protein
MLSLHLEAATYEDLLKSAEQALGTKFYPVADAPKQPAPVPAADSQPQPTTEAPARGRGRPRKSEQAAAAQPSGEPASAPAAAPQETVGNGTSASPTTPPADSAPAATPAPATPAPAAAAGSTTELTLDKVKEALQKVAARNNGQGLDDASRLINQFGYAKVKDIQPQHFAVIFENCRKILAA